MIKTLAQQVGGGLIGQGMGMLDEAIHGNRRRRKQIEQQQKLTDMGTEQSKELMKLGKKQQMSIWDETNYSAQMEQMAKAGLNPAMIYGQGGGAGALGTIGGAGGPAGQASGEAESKQADIASQAMGLQMAKLNAEIRNIEAKTDNLEVDSEKKGAEKEGIETNTILTQMNIDIGQEKRTLNLEKLKTESEIAVQELIQEMNKADVSTATKETEIQKYKDEASEVITNIILKEAQTKMSNAQRKKLADDIKVAYKNAESGRIQADKMTIGQVLGTFVGNSNIGNDIIEVIEKILPGNKIESLVERTIEGGEHVGKATSNWIKQAWENDLKRIKIVKDRLIQSLEWGENRPEYLGGRKK